MAVRSRLRLQHPRLPSGAGVVVEREDAAGAARVANHAESRHGDGGRDRDLLTHQDARGEVLDRACRVARAVFGGIAVRDRTERIHAARPRGADAAGGPAGAAVARRVHAQTAAERVSRRAGDLARRARARVGGVGHRAARRAAAAAADPARSAQRSVALVARRRARLLPRAARRRSRLALLRGRAGIARRACIAGSPGSKPDWSRTTCHRGGCPSKGTSADPCRTTSFPSGIAPRACRNCPPCTSRRRRCNKPDWCRTTCHWRRCRSSYTSTARCCTTSLRTRTSWECKASRPCTRCTRPGSRLRSCRTTFRSERSSRRCRSPSRSYTRPCLPGTRCRSGCRTLPWCTSRTDPRCTLDWYRTSYRPGPGLSACRREYPSCTR